MECDQQCCDYIISDKLIQCAVCQQIAVWSAGQECSPSPCPPSDTDTGQLIFGPALLRTVEARPGSAESAPSESDRLSWSPPAPPDMENLFSSSTSITRLPASDAEGDPAGLVSESCSYLNMWFSNFKFKKFGSFCCRRKSDLSAVMASSAGDGSHLVVFQCVRRPEAEM